MTKRKHSAVVKAAKTGFQMDSIHTDNSETKEIATITSTGSLEHVGQLDGCIASSADNEGGHGGDDVNGATTVEKKIPANKGKSQLSEAERLRAVELHSSGMTFAEMSRVMNRSGSSLCEAVKRWNTEKTLKRKERRKRSKVNESHAEQEILQGMATDSDESDGIAVGMESHVQSDDKEQTSPPKGHNVYKNLK